MNFFRWLSFWPVSMTFGFVTCGTVLLLGGLLLGHWWFTGCLVLVAGFASLPLIASFLAADIAPRINQFTVWSILLPFSLISMLAVYTMCGLVFGDYEGASLSNPLFSSISPWWASFSCNLGLIWGVGLTWDFWDFCLEEQALFDHLLETQLAESSSSPSGGAAEAA